MAALADIGFFEGIVRDLTSAVIVGMLLVWLPYSLARALTDRVLRRRRVQERAAV